jgi:AbrB family looped-hinge helix DNA binding protein
MHTRITVSSKGQVIIPRAIRNKLGLHLGSELALHLRKDRVLELQPVERNLKDFFGKGKSHIGHEKLSVSDIDQAIAASVSQNDRD